MADNVPVTRPLPQPIARIDFPSMITMVIERNLDPAVLQSLLQMYNEQQDRYNMEALNNAVAAVCADVIPVMKNAENTHSHYRYTNYTGLMEMLQPILNEHRVRVSFDLGALPGEEPVRDGYVRIRLVVGFGGASERSSWLDESTSRTGSRGGAMQMTEQQATGSAITYAQRRLLKAKFNIVSADEDDDGEGTRGTTAQSGTGQATGGATAGNGDAKPLDTGRAMAVAETRLAQAQTLEGVDAFLNTPAFVAWRKTIDERTEFNLTAMISGARARIAALSKPTDQNANLPEEVKKLLGEIDSAGDAELLHAWMTANSGTLVTLFPPDAKLIDDRYKAKMEELEAKAKT